MKTSKEVNGKEVTSKEKEILAPVVRSSAGLRDALFDEMDRMRRGETNATNANAMARLVDQVVNTVDMEIRVQEFLMKNPAVKREEAAGRLPSPVLLGVAPPV